MATSLVGERQDMDQDGGGDLSLTRWLTWAEANLAETDEGRQVAARAELLTMTPGGKVEEDAARSTRAIGELPNLEDLPPEDVLARLLEAGWELPGSSASPVVLNQGERLLAWYVLLRNLMTASRASAAQSSAAGGE